MRTLKTSEAAGLLGVSPNTLRTWERRFGFPKPHRSPGGHRLYVHVEIAALRAALEDGLSISSAVSVASDSISADGHLLVSAVAAFRGDKADSAMERSLALRSPEGTITDVLLPALAEVRRRKGDTSAAWAFATRWAADWLSRALRMTPSDRTGPALLIGDASDGCLDPSVPYIRALELCASRAGAVVLALPVRVSDRLSEAIADLNVAMAVIAGGHAPDDEVARWAYAVRRAAGNVPFLLFHRTPNDALHSTRAHVLPRCPVAAKSGYR